MEVYFMKILVTGFDPFGGEPVNPAIESVKRLPDEIAGAQIIKLEIPTVIYKSLEKIDAKIAECDPDVILSIGQAGGRPDITVERVGINCNDCRIPDNEGNQPIDEPIYADGPDAYFSKLPIKAMVKAVNAAGIPASVSDTAGTFICNHVMYGVRYICEHKYPGKRSGFVHIPYMTSQAVGKRGVPSMSLDDIVKGLTAAIEAIVKNETDIKETGGKIC
jgi:pyroglutamyl-peptidase